jgi:hypothetical protein
MSAKPRAAIRQEAPPASDFRGHCLINVPLVAATAALCIFLVTGLAVMAWLIARSAGAQRMQRPAPIVADLGTQLELPWREAAASTGASHRPSTAPKPGASRGVAAVADPFNPPPVAESHTGTTTVSEPAAGETVAAQPPATETYGTSVAFLCSPARAARQARNEEKLLFLLHISGNFEEARFT